MGLGKNTWLARADSKKAVIFKGKLQNADLKDGTPNPSCLFVPGGTLTTGTDRLTQNFMTIGELRYNGTVMNYPTFNQNFMTIGELRYNGTVMNSSIC